jgi:ABC-2 type transport system permease protein
MLFFMSRLFNSVDVPAIERYGGDYIAFSFVGLILITYSFTSLRSFASSLRIAQTTGTLEVLLVSRASLPTIIVGWSLFPFLEATLKMLLLLAAGFLILGLRLEDANLVGSLLVLVLTVVVMASLGIMSAGFTLVFKQGDPFTGLIVAASGILSGVMYPVSVLPNPLSVLANFLPHTYSIEAMRLAILKGYSVTDLAPQLVALLIFAAVLVPSSLLAFNYAMYRAKIDGSLAHY